MKALSALLPKAVVHELHRRTSSALVRIDRALDDATTVAQRINERETKR